jgi:hypothetical protein
MLPSPVPPARSFTSAETLDQCAKLQFEALAALNSLRAALDNAAENEIARLQYDAKMKWEDATAYCSCIWLES